jgi:hypothetical protein
LSQQLLVQVLVMG